MARSYFNQLVQRAGQDAVLAPLRPVASLWKAAQIDAVAAGRNSEAVADGGRRAPGARRSPTVDGEQSPAGQSAAPDSLGRRPAHNVEPRPARKIAPEAQPASRIRSSSIELSPASPHEMKRFRSSDFVSVSNSEAMDAANPGTGTTRPPAARRSPAEPTSLPVLETGAPAVNGGEFLAEPASHGAGRVLAPRSHAAAEFSPTPRGNLSPNAPLPAVPDAGDRNAPVRRERRVAPSVRAAGNSEPALAGAYGEPVSHRSATASPIAERAAPEAPARQPQRASLDPTASTRSREQPAGVRQGSTAEAPRNAERSGVQIGKIEVQIVPPPVTSFRPSPPPQPKDRLARGYALWPGW